MKNLKKQMRQSVLKKRSALSEVAVYQKSAEIIKKLTGFEAFHESIHIMCYVDFRNEVMTKDFIHHCLAQGKKVSIPVIVERGGQKQMIASWIEHLESDLELGSFGILEPKKHLIREVQPEALDFVVVPGVAFDTERYRMGYGGGYYDRFLQAVSPGCLKVGVAFEIQMLDSIPVEPHDIKLDTVVTEERIL